MLDQLIGRPGRELVDDARFPALAEMANSDAYVAMMDGKYHYNLWRAVTAIRHAESDGNDATTPDAAWEPQGETPAHPEYPCGHCLSAAAIGAVIAREFGDVAPPLVLQMEGAMLRRFDSPREFVDDVSLSRLWLGVHERVFDRCRHRHGHHGRRPRGAAPLPAAGRGCALSAFWRN